MLACLTANINRAEKTEPIKHTVFLKYPTADLDVIERLCPEAASICLSIVPTTEMAEILLHIREELVASYVWSSDRCLYY
jgi:hypothetical protein